MYKALVAVDENYELADQLSEAVEALAEAVDELEVTIVHVFRDVEVPSQVSIHQPSSDYEEMLSELREVPPTIEAVVERIEAADADVEVRVLEGDPARSVIELGEQKGVDAIYIGGRKHSPTGKAVFGSVVQGVLLNTEVPVMVVGSPDG